MTFSNYLYSERFRSPRGIFDANLLCSPNAWTNDLGFCHPPPTTTLLPQASVSFPAFPPPANTNGVGNRKNSNPDNCGVASLMDDDPAYLWRLRIYPNGSTKKHNNHLSLYLEAIQSLYEKQNYIMKRSVQFKFSIWRLIKRSHSNTANSINTTTSSSAPPITNNKFYGFSTFSRNNSHPLCHDSSKEFPELVRESPLQKWDFEFHGANSTFGFPTLGTFCELFPDVDLSYDELDLVVRVHIYNNNSMLLPFVELCNEFLSTGSSSYIDSPATASFENFFNNEAYYDVAFTFEEKEDNEFVGGRCIDEMVKSEKCVGELNHVKSTTDNKKIRKGRTIKAHRVILVQRSEYFAKFLSGIWKDGSLKIIPIQHVPFETFRVILYFLYTFKLEDGLDFDTLKDVYVNADMMRLEQLAQLVADRIILLVDRNNWDQVLEIGWKSNCLSSKAQLKTAAYDFIYRNWLTIRDSDQLILLIRSASIDCIEELMEAKMFGPLK
ncbi:2336_t:CDS:1 [Acaulospora colombiana]|uniref:2336_t:CDS:1 n=1 Tax=Acaulospora colombiana TaxID=27376 RepID=A0ACA9KIA1_9GLOM|nr:2336_t:CDS:1 [Acaulospora colombiana]